MFGYHHPKEHWLSPSSRAQLSRPSPENSLPAHSLLPPTRSLEAAGLFHHPHLQLDSHKCTDSHVELAIVKVNKIQEWEREPVEEDADPCASPISYWQLNTPTLHPHPQNTLIRNQYQSKGNEEVTVARKHTHILLCDRVCPAIVTKHLIGQINYPVTFNVTYLGKEIKEEKKKKSLLKFPAILK